MLQYTTMRITKLRVPVLCVGSLIDEPLIRTNSTAQSGLGPGAFVECCQRACRTMGWGGEASPEGAMWRGAVQVKVWLQGGEKAHYYVLSRFLVSRALTVTRIPHMKAVKIALELKKFCVDNDLLDISQVCRNSAPSRAPIPRAFNLD